MDQYLRDILLGPLPALARLLVVGPLAYVALVLLLRVSGKRTLAKLNAFDLIVTIALGSTLASALLSPNVSVAAGILGFSLLIALQLAIAWLSVHVRWVRRAARTEPTLLVRDGQVLPEALVGQRVAHEEVCQAVRSAGYGGLDLVAAVVLETDGTLSVIPRSQAGSGDTLGRLTTTR